MLLPFVILKVQYDLYPRYIEKDKYDLALTLFCGGEFEKLARSYGYL